METKVSQESLQSRLSFFTTGSSFQATETILATGTIIWKPALIAARTQTDGKPRLDESKETTFPAVLQMPLVKCNRRELPRTNS